MRRRLLRAAIALYPRAWRRRYGDELEQLVLDAEAAETGWVLNSVPVIAGIAASGIAERFREMRLRSRIVGFALLAVAAGLLVNAVAVANDPASGPAATGVKLTGNTVIGPGIQIANATAPDQGVQTPTAASGQVIVTMDPATGNVESILGAPVNVVMDPQTGVIVSVQRAATAG